MRKYPHGIASAVFILLSFLYCLKAPLMLTDTDFWWHVSAGDVIRQLGVLPFHDSFSFTAGNYQWLNISWLSDVAYSWMVQIGGYYLPLLLTAIINALTMAILVGFMLKRGVGPVLTIVTLLLCLIPYSYMLTPRPHQMTFLMTIIFYALCHYSMQNKSWKMLAALPFLMVIWVNIHGGFLVGFVVIATYSAQSLFKREWLNFRNLVIMFTACLLATLVNPLGVQIFAACARTLSSALLPYISEWQPLQFDQKHFWHGLYVFVFLLSFRPLNKEVDLAEKLLSVMWLIATLKHERNLSIFVLLSAPVLALNLKSIVHGKLAIWLAKKDANYQHDFTNFKVKRFLFCFALFQTFILLAGVGKILIHPQISSLQHPVTEAQFLTEHFKDRRILNDYFQGGFLLNKLNGSSKIFIDGRAETAYPPEVVADYLQFYTNAPGWEKIITKYSINAALIPRQSTQNYFFSTQNGWQKVLSGPLDNLYVKH